MKIWQRIRRGVGKAAFTLVELMVAVAVFVLIMALLFQVLSGVSDIWRKTTGKVGTFQAGRAAFEALTRSLSQATLQTYFGYADSDDRSVPLFNPSFKLPSGQARDKVPTQYLRASELHFLSGPAAGIFNTANANGLITSGHAIFFQAPLGFVNDRSYGNLDSLLTVCGYFIEFGDNEGMRPTVLNGAGAPPKSYRYRLVEVLQPAEVNAIYNSTNVIDANGMPVENYDLDWVKNLKLADKSLKDAGNGYQHVLADNVILLLFLPKLSPQDEQKLNGTNDGSFLAPNYAYDSRLWEPDYRGNLDPLRNDRRVKNRMRNQLPSIVEVIMVAIDETSAKRLADLYGGAAGNQPPLQDGGLRAKLGLDAFTDPAMLNGPNGDLAKLENGLQELRLNYRIFRSDVQIQGAKWSDDAKSTSP